MLIFVIYLQFIIVINEFSIINHAFISDDASSDYYMSFQKDGKMSNSTWAAYTGEIKEVIAHITARYFARLNNIFRINVCIYYSSNVHNICNVILIDV